MKIQGVGGLSHASWLRGSTAMIVVLFGCDRSLRLDEQDGASSAQPPVGDSGVGGSGSTNSTTGSGGAHPTDTRLATVEFHRAPGPDAGNVPFKAWLGTTFEPVVFSHRRDGSLLDHTLVDLAVDAYGYFGTATLMVEDGGTITTFYDQAPLSEWSEYCSKDAGYGLVTFVVPAGLDPIEIGAPGPVSPKHEVVVHTPPGEWIVRGCGPGVSIVTDGTQLVDCGRELVLSSTEDVWTLVDYESISADTAPIHIYFDAVLPAKVHGSYNIVPANAKVVPINLANPYFDDQIASVQVSSDGAALEISCDTLAPLSSTYVAFEVPGSAAGWAPPTTWNSATTIDVERVDRPVQSKDSWSVGTKPGDFLVLRSFGYVDPASDDAPCFTWHRFLPPEDYSFEALTLPPDLQALIPFDRTSFGEMNTDSWSLDALESDGYVDALGRSPEQNWIARSSE